jgi:hypothetical protein
VVTDPFHVAFRVADAFERCGLRYLVGGSLASAVSGEPRSTLDVDVVVAMTEASVEPLLATLGDEFYADAEALRRAIREKSSTNLIHYATSTKVDIFVLGGSPLDEEQMDRRLRVQVTADPDRYLYVYTPEDIILQKLRWFRRGGGVSDRQWRDILGILRVQGDRLDDAYLRRGAVVFTVTDLLDRALQEAGPK